MATRLGKGHDSKRSFKKFAGSAGSASDPPRRRGDNKLFVSSAPASSQSQPRRTDFANAAMEEKVRRSSRKPSSGKMVVNGDSALRREKSPNPSLAIRTQPTKRIREKASATSLASKSDRKKARLRPGISRNSSAVSILSRPGISRNNSSLSVKHLQVPNGDDVAITSGDEADSVMDLSVNALKPIIAVELDEEPLTQKPNWTVRHRIYLDNDLISTTTSTTKPGYHKFQDVLLREQIELRLHTAHGGLDAHFATRHATLRFWQEDGTLAEKWMDKDWDGEKEHEFAMENMNDWTILHLSMGGEDQEEDGSEADQDMSVDQTDAETADEEAMDDDNEEHDNSKGNAYPTMDIISHYISDYHDARNIASAPGVADDDEESIAEDGAETNQNETVGKVEADDDSKDILSTDKPPLIRTNSAPVYHWVEERRRSLEHQLRTYFHCTSAACFNKGGTCLLLSPSQHLHVGVKDLTDWSQQIAHAHRSIAATTLHLASKLVDDQVRAQDERLADVGREREDEDDLGAVLEAHSLLAQLRPAGSKARPVELDPLD